MEISVTEAKAQLTELVRRAEQGEDVVLTRHGQPVARIAPVRRATSREERRAILEQFQKDVTGKVLPGPDAARSQDFLYDEFGLPK